MRRTNNMGKNILTVAFNTNESYKLGVGHIVRCVTLAKKMQEKNNVQICFVTNAEHPILSKEDFNINNVTAKLSCERIRDIFLKIRPDVIIYDIPDLTQQYVVETALPQSFIVILDYYNRNEKLTKADIVFNFHHSEGINRFIEAKFYEGMEYGILRDEFYRYYSSTKKNTNCFDILLTTGSTDLHGITKKILNTLVTYDHTGLVIHVVLGRHCRDKEDIYQLSSKSANRIEIYEGITNMAELMSGMDIAFVSGGVTLFEVVHMNIPTIVVCAHEYAFELASYLDKNNCAINLGYQDRITKQMVYEAIDKLILSDKLNVMKEKQATIEINGASRIADIIFTEVSNRMPV